MDVTLTKQYRNKNYFGTDAESIANGMIYNPSTAGAVDYSKVMQKNTAKTGYILDLPFINSEGTAILEWNNTQNALEVNGELYLDFADDDVTATYALTWNASTKRVSRLNISSFTNPWLRDSQNNIYFYEDGFNVGIGKDLPAYKLDVNGDIYTTGHLYAGSGNLYWNDIRLVLKDAGGFNNIFIGQNVANSFNLAEENIVIGSNAAYALNSGVQNSIIGFQSGYSIVNGFSNTFMGYKSGFNHTGNQSTLIGCEAGFSLVDTTYSSFFGYRAGYNTNSNYNTFIGYLSGYSNEIGTRNTYLGYRAGHDNIADDNTLLGYNALNLNINGSRNTVIGSLAGETGSLANGRILLGYKAGSGNVASDTLFIDNYKTEGNYPLIYGEFKDTASAAWQILRINGQLELPLLNSATAGFVLFYDESTNRVTYGDPFDIGISYWAENINGIEYQGNITVDKIYASLTQAQYNKMLYFDSTTEEITYGDLPPIYWEKDINFDLYYNDSDVYIGKVTDPTPSSLFIAGNLEITGSLTSAKGTANILIGENTGGNSGNYGQYNTFVGSTIGTATNGGGYNTYIGALSATTNVWGTHNLFLGAYAGYYNTESNTLLVDTITRTTEATEKTSSLIYGVFDTNPVNQLLRINAESFELPLLNTSTESNVLYYNTTTGAITYGATPTGGGSATFIGLTDTPASFTANKWLKVNSTGNALEFVDTPSATSQWTTSGSNIYYNTGNVLINTTTDAGYKLDVNGTSRFTGNLRLDNGSYLLALSSTAEANRIVIGADVNGSYIYGSYGTGGTRNLSINSPGGNVGIGTTTDAGYKLDVNGTGRFTSNLTVGGSILANTYFRSTANAAVLGTASSGTVYLRPTAYNSDIAQSTFTTSLATIRTPLSVTGTVTASNFILSSDRRLKKNIKPILTPNIDDVEIVQFNYKNDNTHRLRYGVIAQELEKVHPEMVYTNDEGFKQVAYIDYLLLKMSDKDKRINELEKRLEILEKLIK